jgi:Methionine synthase I (cobalamin-dependent), methyltransferase domain
MRTGSKQMRPSSKSSPTRDCFTSLYLMQGTDELGEYNESGEFMATQIAEYANEGMVNIVGGCCGTTPEHIAAMAEAAAKHGPRKRPEPSTLLQLSGLEPLVVRPDTR